MGNGCRALRSESKLTRRLPVLQVIFQRSRIVGESCALPEVNQLVRPRVAAPGGVGFFWKLPVQAKCPSYSPEAPFLHGCWVMLSVGPPGQQRTLNPIVLAAGPCHNVDRCGVFPFYMCWAARPGQLTSSRASRRSICRTLRPGSAGRCFACCWL